MHTRSNQFRFAAEARLCGFADAPSGNPEANLPKTEVSQVVGEATMPVSAGKTPEKMPISAGETSETMQNTAQDTFDKKSGNLGKEMADIGEVEDSSKTVAAGVDDKHWKAGSDTHGAGVDDKHWKTEPATPGNKPSSVIPEPTLQKNPASEQAEEKGTDAIKNEPPDAAKPSADETSKNSSEDRGTVMAEMKGQTEQLLEAVRDAEAKAEVEGYTPENIKAITAAIDAYIATAGKEQEYLRADDLQTDVGRQQSLDTEVSQQRNRREQLQKEPGATEAKADTKDKAQESGEKNLEQLTAEANEVLDSAKNVLRELPEAQNTPVPQILLNGRFEKIAGGKDQGGNRSAEDIVLKSKAVGAALQIAKGIGYNTKDYDEKTGNGVLTRLGGDSIEMTGGEGTWDLEELVVCDGMPLEQQVQHFKDVVEEVTMALSKEPDQKKVEGRFDKAVKDGSFDVKSFKEKPGEESWRTDAVLTDDLRNLFKDLPKDAQQTAIGRFMENANVRKDAAGNMFLGAKASMALDFKTVAIFAASSADVVERQDANGVPLEMGMKTNAVNISTFLDSVRLRYTDKGSKNMQPDGKVIGNKMEKPSAEKKTDVPPSPDAKIGNELPLPPGLPKDVATKAQEMYATMSPQKQNAFRNAIVSMGALAEDPNKVLSVASLLSKIPDSISAKFDQRNPSFSKEDYTKLADMVSGLTPTELDLFGALVVVPGDRLGSSLRYAGVSPADYEAKLRELAGKASSPDAKGSAGNDKVSGGEPNKDTPQPATPGDKGTNVPEPVAPEAPDAAPPATSEAPAGAPESAKNLQELRSKAAEILGKMREVGGKIAIANGEIQQLKQKQSAPDATQEQKDELQTKIDDLTTTVESLKNDLKTLKEESKGITDQLKEAKGELPKDASASDVAKRKLEDMGDTFKDPNATGGEKLIAAIQAIGAVLALWRGAINGTADKSPDAASDQSTDKKKDGDPTRPADGGNKSPEGQETKGGRRSRLRQELKDPQVKSVDDLLKKKSEQLDKTQDEHSKEFDKTSESVKKTLDQSRVNVEKRTPLINQLRDRNLSPEQRAEVSKKLDTLEKEHKQLMADADKGNEKLESINKVMRKNLDDFDSDKAELQEMQKEVQLVKEGMDTILNQLKELKNPGIDKFIKGVTVVIDPKNLTLIVTAPAPTQVELKTIAPELKFDSTGKLEGDPKQFAEALVKLLNKMKDQPAATPDTPRPAAPDTSSEIKGEMPKVIAGTLKDTLDVLGGRIERAQKNLADQKKDLAEVKSSWNPFRNGEQRNKERAVGMQEAALNVLQNKVDQLKAIPTDDPKKQLDGIMKIREELGLPKVPQEFAKDYDTFQKMAAEGVDKKDKSTEVDYAALNKELQEIDATLANVEMGLEALDTAAGTAASLVPFGSKVYNLSQLATYVATGNKTPQQAGVDFATSFVFGKLGGKALASAGGKKLIEKYSMKFAEKFFSNPNLIKKFVETASKQISGEVLKQVDNVTGIKNSIKGAINTGVNTGMQWLNDGGKWLGENGFALYENTIAPALQNLSADAQKQFAQGMKAFQEIKTGIMTSTATDFAQGYKGKFKEMYGGAVQSATDQIKKIPGLDPAKVDALVAQVTTELEKQFDNAAKTVQDINDKGAGNVLKGFVADLGVVGNDAYETYLRPSVDTMKEEGKQLMANGMQVLNEIRTGVMTSATQDFAKGYKEQFQGLYGAKIEQAKGLLVKAGLDEGKVNQFVGDVSAGIEKQFDAGVKTATEIQQKGVAVVLQEFSADMGTIVEQGYKNYIKPRIDTMNAEARPHMEKAMKQFAAFKEGAAQLIAQDPKQTAQEYVQRLQKAYGPAIEAARTELTQAGITPDNARKFVDTTMQSALDGFQRVAARVQKG